jgi:hypothetical protein
VSLLARVCGLERSTPSSDDVCRCPFDVGAVVAFLTGDAPGDVCRRCGSPLAAPMVLAPYAPEGVRL